MRAVPRPAPEHAGWSPEPRVGVPRCARCGAGRPRRLLTTTAATVTLMYGRPRGRHDRVVTDWAAVLASDCAVPAGSPVRVGELVDELCDMLASPEPRVRDDTAYPVLAMWTARGVLDGRLAVLGDRLAATLRHPEIQARTFAAMILGWVVLRDARTGELAPECVPGWYAAFARWWRGERDLRGWDPGLGWLHAVAHGADALCAFARSPRMTVADLRA